MKITEPRSRNIYFKEIKRDEVSAGGIIMSSKGATGKNMRAEVISVAPDCEEGYKPGDMLLIFDRFNLKELDPEWGIDTYMIREDEIIARIS